MILLYKYGHIYTTGYKMRRGVSKMFASSLKQICNFDWHFNVTQYQVKHTVLYYKNSAEYVKDLDACVILSRAFINITKPIDYTLRVC